MPSPVRHLLLACLALTAIGPAAAQTPPDLRALADRIERLQRDVDVLQRRLATGGAPAAPPSGGGGAPAIGAGEGFVGQTEARFSALDSQQRDLTGKVEEVGFRLQQIEARLEKLVGDVDFRLTQLEGGKPAAPAAGAQAGATATSNRLVLVPSGTGAQALQQGQGPQTQQQVAAGAARAGAPAAAAQPVTLPAGSPEAQYEFAYGVLLQAQRDQTDFGRAEQAMKAFLEKNPSHRLAGNAQYWLGETFWVRKDYQNAALAYGEGVRKYATAEKAPDNMLKFGLSLGQLNRRPDACGALAAFDQRYPSAGVLLKQQAGRERQRLAC